jgi:hypothetical protein
VWSPPCRRRTGVPHFVEPIEDHGTAGLLTLKNHGQSQLGQGPLNGSIHILSPRQCLVNFVEQGLTGLFMESVFGELLSYSQGISILLAMLAFAVFFFGARRAAGRLSWSQGLQTCP